MRHEHACVRACVRATSNCEGDELHNMGRDPCKDNQEQWGSCQAPSPYA